MKKSKYRDIVFDMKTLNICAWLTILVAYVTPYRIGESGKFMYGYPFAFLQIHPMSISRIPLLGSGLDLLMFFIDLYVIYVAIKLINRAIQAFRRPEESANGR